MGGENSKFDDKKLEAFGYTDHVYSDVVNSLPSLEGKSVAITGCSSGLGLSLAKAAAERGASKILMLNRPSERSSKAEQEVSSVATANTTVESIPLDLMDFESVRECAEAVSRSVDGLGGLDVLANNAGIMAFPDKRTKDGFEVQMQTNQLSHALLTKILLPKLEQAAGARDEARVVFHSSSARYAPMRNLKREHFQKSEPGSLGGDNVSTTWEFLSGHEGPWGRYHQTKLANACFAMALHDELQKHNSKIKTAAADPGLAASNLQVTSVEKGQMSSGLANFLFSGNKAQTANDGACPIIKACFASDTESGDFYHPRTRGFLMNNDAKGPPFKSISKGIPVIRGTERLVVSEANKKVVWEETLNAIGETDFF